MTWSIELLKPHKTRKSIHNTTQPSVAHETSSREQTPSLLDAFNFPSALR